MNHGCIDTNVIVRYLVETPETISHKFKGVYSFFARLELGEIRAIIPDIVIFQAYFVLTSYYAVPSAEAAEKLEAIISFRGIVATEKGVVVDSLRRLQQENIDIVDAYLLAYSKAKGLEGVCSFDKDLSARGLRLLSVE